MTRDTNKLYLAISNSLKRNEVGSSDKLPYIGTFRLETGRKSYELGRLGEMMLVIHYMPVLVFTDSQVAREGLLTRAEQCMRHYSRRKKINWMYVLVVRQIW